MILNSPGVLPCFPPLLSPLILRFCFRVRWSPRVNISMHCIVLYCIVFYCIVLYCIVLYCIALYCIVLYCIVLYCIVLYCIVLYYTFNIRFHETEQEAWHRTLSTALERTEGKLFGFLPTAFWILLWLLFVRFPGNLPIVVMQFEPIK